MTSAIILGRARGIWYDLTLAAREFGPFDNVIAVNRTGCDYNGPVHHWVSYHAELFPMWLKMRKDRGYTAPGQLWTTSVGRRGMSSLEKELNIKMVECEGGSSGRVAVAVAREIGCDRIVLAGIPLDKSAGHYDEQGEWCDEVEFYRATWVKDLDQLKPYVRSMSGWTSELLGYPDVEWVQGKTAAA